MLSRTITRFILLLALAAATAALRAADSPPQSAAQLVQTMGDSSLTQPQRDAAASALAGIGKDAMPTLIASLRDSRVFHPRYLATTGVNGGELIVDMTVGVECNTILMDIASDGASRKVTGFKYKVFDWPGWWTQHKDMTPDAIHKEVRKRNKFLMESTGEGDSIPRINQP